MGLLICHIATLFILFLRQVCLMYMEICVSWTHCKSEERRYQASFGLKPYEMCCNFIQQFQEGVSVIFSVKFTFDYGSGNL